MDVWRRFIIKISVYPCKREVIKGLLDPVVFFCFKNKKDSNFTICESCEPDLCKSIELNVTASQKHIDTLNKMMSRVQQSILEMKDSGAIKDYEFKNFTYGKTVDSQM